ncbi:hypothetical protein LZP81_33870 [Streptomyces parvulus]|uniref:hypothetical protein n=1 Tax=Streptomyces parvulus TaxID=146923 RepID=UPI001E5FC73A|nr:hypothetical protein [Streptomyces parvulus]MCC9154812.1 hypothetical protein [Streptomyces parvulus]MCE7691844.1 hypothetical protein [Streptomyces parvulus]
MAVIVPCGSFSGADRAGLVLARNARDRRPLVPRSSPPPKASSHDTRHDRRHPTRATARRPNGLLVSPDSWSVQHATAYALLSTCVIIALFMPLAVSRYRRVARG